MKNIFLAILARWSKQRNPKPENEKRPIRWVSDGERLAPDQPPSEAEERFVVHHLRNVEPSDAWKIE